ncbi:MAG TPA: hypothetical protein VJT15_06145 [Pyrinomonadaceae bacterium]|nr:hypothetical protein [Pyrinomonadaceae bacterium]
MATSEIEVDFLHCDQGMGTLLRIYDSSGRLAHLALFDLGSESGTRKYSDSAIDSVTSALKEMEDDGFTPTIDLLLISHQDFDHWSLLPTLLEKIQVGFPSCVVEDIYYGGLKWRKRASGVIVDWEDQFGIDAEPLGREVSNYKKPGTKGMIKTIDGVAIRVLCVNVPVSRSAEDLERNGTSAVVAIDFGGVTAVIPGDATADTLGWINNNVFDRWKAASKPNPVQPCRALGAPHHGALRTIADNFTSTNPNLSIANAFAKNVAAENVIASAGYLSKFNHPYRNVMELLAVHATTDALAHDFVWYNGAIGVWERVQDDERGIFTTVLTLTNPPQRTGWYFTITSTGVITFHIDWEQAEEIPFRRTDRHGAVPHTR